MDLSIVIPFQNERESLAEVVAGVRKACAGLDYELILIDDGSMDGSSETLAMQDRHCVIRHERGRGYGFAIKRGMEAAGGDWIAILDGDGSYRPEDIPRLWEEREGVEMVIGKRDPTGIPPIRRPPKWMLRQLAQILSGEKIPDLNSGLRVFRRDRALRYLPLYPNGFSLTTTLTMAFLSSGREVRYVPIDYLKRTGRSKIRPFRDTWNFTKLLLRLILFFNPMKVLLPLALLLFCLSVFILFFSKYVLGELMDVTVTVFFMLSVQLAMLAVLADLIARRNRD